MFDADARIYKPSNVDIMKIQGSSNDRPFRVQEKREPKHKKPWSFDKNEFKKKYGIFLILIALFTVWNLALIGTVHYKTEKKVWAEAKDYYDAQLEAYKQEQAEAEQAAHWLSGDASREAFINQEIEAGAKLIALEANDQVKGTKLGTCIARKLNKNYPDTIRECAKQPDQYMYYSDDNTYTQHDWDLSESMIRPLYEDGIIPNGLTSDIVFLDWRGTTAIARDSYEASTSMRTWVYQG